MKKNATFTFLALDAVVYQCMLANDLSLRCPPINYATGVTATNLLAMLEISIALLCSLVYISSILLDILVDIIAKF